eukprot:scaffold15366_cov70-Phaeocystis_antarctica.AAC.9
MAKDINVKRSCKRLQEHLLRRDGAQANRARRGAATVLCSLHLVANLAIEHDGQPRLCRSHRRESATPASATPASQVSGAKFFPCSAVQKIDR